MISVQFILVFKAASKNCKINKDSYVLIAMDEKGKKLELNNFKLLKLKLV